MPNSPLAASSVTVYTAITGGKDAPRDDGVLCFSDYSRFVDPRLNAKIYKALPHQFVVGDVSIWVDGRIKLLVSPEKLASLMTGDVCVFRHWKRNCIYDEAQVCIRRRLDNAKTIQRQMSRYKAMGYPKGEGLAACGVVMRRNTPQVNAMNERWWSEICTYSTRDQLSFPFCFRDHIQWLDGDPRGVYFTMEPHARPDQREIHFDKYQRKGAYHWDEYERRTKYGLHADFVAAWIKERPVLDVGAGDGLICSLIDGIGLDNNEYAIQLAKERGVFVQQGSAYKLPFADSSFLAVYMGDIIEHLQDPQLALREVRRVLVPNGTLYVATPPRKGPLRPYHCKEYAPDELTEEATSVGFHLCDQIVIKFGRMYGRFQKGN
ncbi:MAG: DUF616 domain-containing protein [Planctomycetaceae bacterium]|nr:DUF616 domain-containing protein [Planctomycetaceae bacterium]MCB9953645.1 DUF616 domain-containing protein [Planctomycetaceae bacterium]